MTDPSTHLSEDERQMFAGGELPADRVRDVEHHIADCADCAADVARLERLMMHVRNTAAPTPPIDELWSDIRARVEAAKVAPFAGNGTTAIPSSRRWLGLTRRAIAAAAIVATMVGITGVAGVMLAPRLRESTQSSAASAPQETAAPAVSPALTAVADSERLYEQEAQLLLNRLELERSMLRPETARAVDRDLRVIDQAIVELKDAVARDPRNAALHQLLASSYRQKAELLKRLANAG